MPTAKAKTVKAKTVKAKGAKTKTMKKTAPRKTVAKKPTLKLVAKTATKPAKQKTEKRTFAKPNARESFYARLLREKAERHEKFQQQHQQDHHMHGEQRMPVNHARFGRYAGPRRRAS